MRLALYQPEIPQNTGTLMRLCACMGISLEVIHPCGFVWEDRRLRRAGMDYMDIAAVQHHTSWEVFSNWTQRENHRLILLDAKAQTSYTDFVFKERDILMMGQESCGVPEDVFKEIPHRLKIPMIPNCRSLNVSLAAAMVVGEALRQLKIQPKDRNHDHT
ncbi:MAG: tRNA (cytidine(34)-2'-O)-methyltransferase [Alphaproteobacteria bacterium]|jgi:tRNA (cytidine/uridine-2'-O-)-methyltransferase|nr:tRNA (cytidine(34)-2'-O)-methyltransferase [Alphaproteobacteria bacterium]